VNVLIRLLNVYPPFLLAGIRVRSFRGDPLTLESRMALRFYNRNAFGTHFGGSLYAMCDPFFVLILARALGKGYDVWDKAASIEFLRPGRGTVRARFHVPKEEVDRIRSLADAGEKLEPVYEATVTDEAGEAVARVTKRLWIRKARPRPPREAA
jgi:acyl-coenzyme A thioesterase PaaI-like protein